MTLYVLIFWLLLPVIAIAALRWGGWPERATALLDVAAAVATLAARSQWASRYGHVETGVLAVDAGLLVGMLVITVKADRWWPILATALQAVSTLAHVAKAVNPDFWRLAYAMMSGASSYPTLLLLALATWRHRARAASKSRTSLPL